MRAARMGTLARVVPARTYVQDERYAAGAWMHRSGLLQFCTAFARLLPRTVLTGTTRPSFPSNDVHLSEITNPNILKELGLSSSESGFTHLSETIDSCIGAKARMCSSLLPDLLRQESRMSDTWMYSSASGSKLLHSLGFPYDQWFSTCKHEL